ncbi:MAG: 50S ribosome-binding GTPase, partial [Desulfamplus sp.]|nr:50S ribosome-binding GTPase [Desulfamplus sp.]
MTQHNNIHISSQENNLKSKKDNLKSKKDNLKSKKDNIKSKMDNQESITDKLKTNTNNFKTNTNNNQNRTDYVILGNINAGKSTLFDRLTHSSKSHATNIPGTTVSITSGKIQGLDAQIYDTPGIYSIFSSNEDERASRDILLIPSTRNRLQGLILVADAKNLKRSIAIALQFSEYGLPMLLDINMIDEALSRGIEINVPKLSELLGIEICTTIAREGIGVETLNELFNFIRIVQF